MKLIIDIHEKDYQTMKNGHIPYSVHDAIMNGTPLEAQPKPMEKFDDVKTHIQRLAGDYKCWDNRLTWEEALELNRMFEAQPNRCDICKHSEERDGSNCYECVKGISDNFEALPSEDCISREAVIRLVEQYPNIIGNRCVGLMADIKHLPSVTPQRPKGKWLHIYKSDIACECSVCHIQMPITEYFHYCPNCGSEMNGGGEECNSTVEKSED